MIDDVRREFPGVRIPVIDGGLKLVYEPDPDRPNSWMVNDHCLIRDEQGALHFFGIENPYPTTTQALDYEFLWHRRSAMSQPFRIVDVQNSVACTLGMNGTKLSPEGATSNSPSSVRTALGLGKKGGLP